MSVYDASTIVIDDCRVICQIVTSLSDNSRDVIYHNKVFMKVAPEPMLYNFYLLPFHSKTIILCY